MRFLHPVSVVRVSICRRYVRNHSRRMISGVLLVWLVLLQFPLPFEVVTVDASGKDLTVPFPCMYRACGCRSAEDCWTSCCCTTCEERIAFIREYGLEMPASLEGNEPEQVARVGASSGNCCSKPAPASTSEDQCPVNTDQDCSPKPGLLAACSRRSSGGTCPDQTDDAPPEEGGTRRVLLSAYLKCKGLSVQIALFSAGLLPEPAEQDQSPDGPVETLSLIDDLWAGVLRLPPLPPPRLLIG